MNKKTKDIPIVFSMLLNYKNEKYGLYNNSRVSGISLEVPAGITFMQIKMLAPEIKKVGFLYSDKSKEIVDSLKKQESELDVEFITLKTDKPNKIISNFKKLLKENIQAYYMVADAKIYGNSSITKELVDLCIEAKIPFIAYSDAFVKAGALMSVSPSYPTIGSQAASVAENILVDKTPPKEIGIMPPIGTFFVINAETSKKIELNVSEDLLGLADKVYKK
jgi:putative ABC transport system substrate-binding protein